MENTSVILDIAIIFIAALSGGLIAERLKQSPLVGYIAGGILVGPYLTGLISNLQMVNSFADIGIVLLMFTLGIEFSLKRLEHIRKIALLGGAIQIIAVIILGFITGRLMGLGFNSSIFLGCVLSISSTMIVLRVLGDQGELDSIHGQIMLGILIVQDLAVILMVSILPNLEKFADGNTLLFIFPLIKALVFIIIMLYFAEKIMPVIMERVARASNNDVFLLFALSIGLGVAVLTQATGLSLSLGAFLGGLLISESDYAHEILGKIVTLRDAFVVIFFVSVGMLINPARLFIDVKPLLVILAVIIPGKFLVFFVITRLFNYHSRIAFYTGTGMMQIGEFSFVMAKIGLDTRLISAGLYNLILASALISIVLTPLFVRRSPVWYQRLSKIDRLRKLLPDRPQEEPLIDNGLDGHIIVCGYGRMGANVCTGIRQLNLPLLVIDYDYFAVKSLAGQQIPYLYGDVSSDMVLKQARPELARMAILTLPDALVSRQTIFQLKQLNPGIIVLARAHNQWQAEILGQAGATEVIQPESEAGFHILRHLILNLNLPSEKVNRYLEQLYYIDYQKIARENGYENSTPLRIKEFKIDKLSTLAEVSLNQSGIREHTGCNVATIRKENGQIIFNPAGDEVIQADDYLVIMGDDFQMAKFIRYKAGELG